MVNRIMIVVYGLIAMFLIAVDIILWFKLTPQEFSDVFAAIILGVLGLFPAYLSFKCYKKEVKNVSN